MKEFIYYINIQPYYVDRFGNNYSFRRVSDDAEIARIVEDKHHNFWYHNWLLSNFNSFEECFLSLKNILCKSSYEIIPQNKIVKLKAMA